MIESDDGLYLGTLGEVGVFIHNGTLSSEYFSNMTYGWTNVGAFEPRSYQGNFQVSGGCLIKW